MSCPSGYPPSGLPAAHHRRAAGGVVVRRDILVRTGEPRHLRSCGRGGDPADGATRARRRGSRERTLIRSSSATVVRAHAVSSAPPRDPPSRPPARAAAAAYGVKSAVPSSDAGSPVTIREDALRVGEVPGDPHGGPFPRPAVGPRLSARERCQERDDLCALPREQRQEVAVGHVGDIPVVEAVLIRRGRSGFVTAIVPYSDQSPDPHRHAPRARIRPTSNIGCATGLVIAGRATPSPS